MENDCRLIDANALLRDINNYFDNSPFPHPGTNWRRGFEFAAELILFAPTVDAVEVVHGRWVKKTEDYVYYYACSECGEPVLKSQWGHDFFSDYCPNCGAKMDGDGNV